ncbi:MAG: hypothetical protein RIR11_1319 [Bacteroidota bacterium]
MQAGYTKRVPEAGLDQVLSKNKNAEYRNKSRRSSQISPLFGQMVEGNWYWERKGLQKWTQKVWVKKLDRYKKLQKGGLHWP